MKWLRLIGIDGLQIVRSPTKWRLETIRGDEVLHTFVNRIFGKTSDDNLEQQ